MSRANSKHRPAPGLSNIDPAPLSEGQVRNRFKRMINSGHKIHVDGQAGSNPKALLKGYLPKYLIEFQEHQYYLTNVRRDNQFRFFVAYIVLSAKDTEKRKKSRIHPRIFYKDSSLVWRVATHYIKTESDHWIGKGDIKPSQENGETVWYTAEETTNLPFEIQNGLDLISRRTTRVQPDRRALQLILRNAPSNRVHPYEDFSRPRREAMKNPAQLVYGNRLIARFKDLKNPRSLWIAKGFEPDFSNGLIDSSSSFSKLYGGPIMRFRIASVNRRVQYLFMHGPQQNWIIPPQTMDANIISYGVRAVDAHVDDNLCIPGYEYHFLDHDDDPDSLYTQIPKGFAGPASDIDPQRADASPWNHAMPVMKSFQQALPKLKRQSKL